ncbi:MAG: hypothetical protein WC469_00320 [Candidatus Omnitrophota bacterium]
MQGLIRRSLVVCLIGVLAGWICGCEAVARKFTRKSKKEAPREEMILAPEEYHGPKMSKEEIYRQYFLYWKSWHGELIQSLTDGKNRKKQIDCVGEELKNLYQLRSMLNSDMQGRLDTYINKVQDLKSSLMRDIYGSKLEDNRQRAERIRMDILRDFSYIRIKDSLR